MNKTATTHQRISTTGSSQAINMKDRKNPPQMRERCATHLDKEKIVNQ